ncbi:MAG: alpha/beta fold hydrolase [Halioglobus sp.]
MTSQPRQLQWQVDDLTIAGLAWGDENNPPLLALHGWLDNAASFALLAPFITNRQIVALDLTGHGLSDSRSPHSGYQIWEDLPQILGVADQLGWGEFDLLGHSRGGIISTLVAAAAPARVRKLILLDALLPRAVEEDAFSVQLQEWLRDRTRYLNKAPARVESLDQAIKLRAAKGLTLEAATVLMQRNLKPLNDAFTWTTDPRLFGASAVKLTATQSKSVLQSIAAPVLLMMASDGYAGHPEITESAESYLAERVIEVVQGGHHFHMEDNAQSVAQRICTFLEA